MAFVPAILIQLGVTSPIVSKSLNDNPQSMIELNEQFGFEQPSTPFTWEDYCAKRDEVQFSYALAQVRIRRNKELTETDWIEMPYNRESLANLDEWLTYRQALRDITTNLTINDIAWTFYPGSMPGLQVARLDALTRPSVVRK
jgi:hypothetical protein